MIIGLEADFIKRFLQLSFDVVLPSQNFLNFTQPLIWAALMLLLALWLGSRAEIGLTTAASDGQCSVEHYVHGFEMKTISAGDANRHFSKLLRDVASGTVITVLSRGKPVATISPAHSGDGQRQAARLCLLERLRHHEASGARNWTRDELYES